MVIYQIHEISGQWEDREDIIIASYLHKSRAEADKVVLEESLKERWRMYKKCCKCPATNRKKVSKTECEFYEPDDRNLCINEEGFPIDPCTRFEIREEVVSEEK